jgi:hypothetical protein
MLLCFADPPKEARMRIRLPIMVLVVASLLLTAEHAFACTVRRITTGVGIPLEMVAQSDLIVRVTALDYAAPPANANLRTSGVPDSKVRFRIEEIVKGSYSTKEIVLSGYLSGSDDWNDRPVPYDFVRPGGRSGSCFANTYRVGGQFLLVLKRNLTDLTVNWYALGPVNEQLRSENDPWLLWVRQQVAQQ